MQEVDEQRFRYICATVAPFNIASLKGDVVLWDAKSYQEIQYFFGVNHVKSVWKKGEKVV